MWGYGSKPQAISYNTGLSLYKVSVILREVERCSHMPIADKWPKAPGKGFDGSRVKKWRKGVNFKELIQVSTWFPREESSVLGWCSALWTVSALTSSQLETRKNHICSQMANTRVPPRASSTIDTVEVVQDYRCWKTALSSHKVFLVCVFNTHWVLILTDKIWFIVIELSR